MSAVARVEAAFEQFALGERPEAWIAVQDRADAVAEAAAVDARVAAGQDLPLAGLTVAVKDNIDVAGFATTAACPAYAFRPGSDAPAVARLRAAGAIVLGKTNLDQFATGLVGTRSPYGAVRDVRRPEYVSGGSSSGSAVAVALGIADLALGTDTAGSGRVPAAFQGIVGLKPTRGLVPVTGVVPACRTLDCVTVFAANLELARVAAAVLRGIDPRDPLGRAWPADAPLAAPPAPRVGVPSELPGLSAAARAAFVATVERLRDQGAELVEVDVAPFLEAGALLYGGAFVAERHAAVGAFIAAHPDDVDPAVGLIIAAAAGVSASQLVRDGETRDSLALRVRAALADLDAILLPTVPHQPTIAAVAADPIGENAKLGLYTNCANLLDLAAVSVPAGEADSGCFGVTVLGPAFGDEVAADVAALLVEGAAPARTPATAIELFVAGAHLRGQPLNHQLTDRGARFLRAARTAPRYRLYALATEPPKPGVVRTPSGGARLEGELWALSPAALGTLLAAITQPMALGAVALEDGRDVVGFLCEPVAVDGAEDITAHGGWRAYRAAG